MVQKYVIPVIILSGFLLIYSGCGKIEKSGSSNSMLPDKIEIPKPGKVEYISPRALIDSVNSGKELDIFYISELQPENPDHIVPVPGMVTAMIGEVTELVRKLPQNRNIYLVCLYGDDSRRMADLLSRDGYNCYSLDGGSFRLWNEMQRNGWRFLPRFPLPSK